MTSTIKLPDPAETGRLADGILTAIHADPEYVRLIDGCGRYNDDWTTTSGTVTIERWSVDSDAVPLIEEAVRALPLKAAVYALTSDEDVSELPVAAPVDEVLHAVLCQRTLTERLAERCGFQLIYAADTEQAGQPYEPGCYTWRAYLEAFKVAPLNRYWIGHTEHQRRAAIVGELLEGIGLHDRGRRHELIFAATTPAA